MKTRHLQRAIVIATVLVSMVILLQLGSSSSKQEKLYRKLRTYLESTFSSMKINELKHEDLFREKGDFDHASVADFMEFSLLKRRTVKEIYKSRVDRHTMLIKDLFGDPLGDYQLRNFSHDTVTVEPKCTDPPFLLIQVHSAPNHFRSREAIRLSWGNPRNSMNRNRVPEWRRWKTVFVIGQSEISEYNALVHHESCMHKDILVTDFYDSYRNLSRKTVYAVRWAAEKCLPRFMLKTDEDCYVNPFNIVDFLDKYDRTPNNSVLYTGRVQWVMTPYRDNTSRYYISREDYPFDIIPPYVSGGGYLFSGSAIPRLANVSRYQRIIPNEDANFGLLMHAIDVDPVENNLIIPYIYCDVSIWKRNICDFEQPFVIHGVTTFKQIEIHYTVLTLLGSPYVCKHMKKLRKRTDPPLYCPTSG